MCSVQQRRRSPPFSPLHPLSSSLHFPTSLFHLVFHTSSLPPPTRLLPLPPLSSFGFSSQTDQRQSERYPRHIRSMAVIGASESQERKLHGGAHRQHIFFSFFFYFQKPLIRASHLDFGSSDKFHHGGLERRGWSAT